MASPALPLSNIVDVVVQISPVLPVTPTFNQGLIIGNSAVISHAKRIQQFFTLASLLTAGFTTSSPEYIAASLYFGQSPPPPSLWVGLQDLTSLNTIIPHSGNAGTGYVVGDVITVVQSGGSGGQARVTSVSSGAVTGLSVLTGNDGTGYTTATGLSTTGGTGTGLEVDITATGESALTAVQNCRTAQNAWYACMVTSAADADHLAIAAYAQTATPPMMYFLTTADTAVLNNTSGNLCAALQALNYQRVFSMYSTTQSGNAPNNVYACAAAIGVMMGLNTGLANSYFTMMFKTLIGVLSEPLTASQVAVLSGIPGQSLGINCNVYVGYANAYTFLQQGTVANGDFADEILNLDMLVADMQFTTTDLFVSLPSVPQTDPGQTQIIHAVNQCCQRAVTRGYIGPGTWEGVNLLVGTNGSGLSNGDPMPAGYVTLSPPYSSQSTAARAARQAMPVYCAINEAGAAQNVLIGVYVQR
jgi:Protein of unknown function (DUF3383)